MFLIPVQHVLKLPFSKERVGVRPRTCRKAYVIRGESHLENSITFVFMGSFYLWKVILFFSFFKRAIQNLLLNRKGGVDLIENVKSEVGVVGDVPCNLTVGYGRQRIRSAPRTWRSVWHKPAWHYLGAAENCRILGLPEPSGMRIGPFNMYPEWLVCRLKFEIPWSKMIDI